MSSPIEEREVIYEISYIGNSARVAAVDVATGIEAVIQGPRTIGEITLRKNALQKLAYLLRKKD